MTLSTTPLKGKVAIVTGASRGIGKAIALAMADAGADVACASRTVADLEATAAEIRAKGRRGIVTPTDTTKKQDVDNNMVAETVKQLGTVDIMVNCGARSIPMPLMKLREDGWDKVLASMLKGYFLCSQAAATVMIEKKKGGNIINIASIMASMVNPYNGAYGAAKAGAVQLTRALASELGNKGIRCNAIAPGFIKTKMTEAIWTNPNVKTGLVDAIPAGRLGDPEEIAAVAVFLASDAASYITGATICVDGGLTLTGFNPKIFGNTLPPNLQL